MSAARRRPAPSPARDLFDPAPTWVPPKEFSDYLAGREPPGLVVAAPPPPAATLSAPAPPPWAVEAATAPATKPELPRRDFSAAEERVRDGGDRFVLRTRLPRGRGHEYRAYERSSIYGYGVVLPDDPVFGRVDTRRPTFLPDDPHEQIEGQVAVEQEALELIRRVCPETVRGADEHCVGAGVYDGPGYVLVTTDPEQRYRAWVAERARAELLAGRSG